MNTKTDAEIRTAVKAVYGAKNARVARNGEIHVRGVMPNTDQYGWYLFGFTGSHEVDARIWHPDGSLINAR